MSPFSFYSETVPAPGPGYGSHAGKFVCLSCGNKFNYKGDVQRHIRNIHTPQPKAACHICRKVFKTPYNRDDHMRKAHGITKRMMKDAVIPNH